MNVNNLHTSIESTLLFDHHTQRAAVVAVAVVANSSRIYDWIKIFLKVIRSSSFSVYSESCVSACRKTITETTAMSFIGCVCGSESSRAFFKTFDHAIILLFASITVDMINSYLRAYSSWRKICSARNGNNNNEKVSFFFFQFNRVSRLQSAAAQRKKTANEKKKKNV